MAIDLFKYLPRYYLESRIMRALMNSLKGEIPDAIDYLWRVFFCNTTPDEGLWLWLREYDAATREEVYAKMRGGGALNFEMLQALGIEAVETTWLCPEAGITLSGNDAFFADGFYIGPLISDIYVDPPEIEVAQRLVALTGMAGFRYWLALKCQRYPRKKIVAPYASLGVVPPLSLVEPWDFDVISGDLCLACSQTRWSFVYRSFAHVRPPWFSPLVDWADNLFWDDDTSYTARSKVTQQDIVLSAPYSFDVYREGTPVQMTDTYSFDVYRPGTPI